MKLMTPLGWGAGSRQQRNFGLFKVLMDRAHHPLRKKGRRLFVYLNRRKHKPAVST